MQENVAPHIPLSTANLYILCALAEGEKHGYGIMQETARHSQGRYKLGPGTLYDNLQKLLESGLVEESLRKPDEDDPRRRYYRLTAFGSTVLGADVARLEKVVRDAKTHLRALQLGSGS